MDSILDTTFTTNLSHDMREYAPYLDIIKSYFFPGLENRLYEGLEMLIYGDRQLLAQFPSWKQCVDSTRAILRDSISSMLHQSTDDESRGFLSGILSQTINYLMKDGLIACIINSIVLNNRLNKVCRDLDTVGAERDFLRHIHVWNFINEKNYWHEQTVQSIRSSETIWHCYHPGHSHKAQIHGENHDFHHEIRFGADSRPSTHQQPPHFSNSCGKLSVCTCGNSSCQCSASETPPTFNQSCSCEDSDCGCKSLEIVVSDGKNRQRSEKSPLPCTSHSLLSIIVKPDASSSPVESEKKFIAAINKTCSFVNSILGQVDKSKIARCRLICRIQEDRINFKLQMKGRNGDKTCLYTDRVDVAVRKPSDFSDQMTVDLNKTLEKECDDGAEKHDLHDFPAEIYPILRDQSNVDEKKNSNLKIPTIVVHPPEDTLPKVENNLEKHEQTMNSSCSSSVMHCCASKTSSHCDTTEEVYITAKNSATNCAKICGDISDKIQADSRIYLSPIKSVKPVEEITVVVETNTVEEFAEAPAEEDKQTDDQAEDCGCNEQVGLSSMNESVEKKVPAVAEEITAEKQCCEVDHSPGSISSRTSESTGSMVNSKVLVIPLTSVISLKPCDTRIIPMVPVIQVETPISEEKRSENDCEVCECDKTTEDQLINKPATEKIIQFDESAVNTDLKPEIDNRKLLKVPSQKEETVHSPKELKIKETKLPNEDVEAPKCTGTCEKSTNVNLSQSGRESKKPSSAVEGSSMKSASSVPKSLKTWSKAEADYGSSGFYCAGDSSLNNLYSRYTVKPPPQIPRCRTPRIVRPTPRRPEKKDTCHQYLPIINKSTRAIVSAVCRCLKRAFPHKTLSKVKHLIARKVHRVLNEREKGTNTLHNRVERGTNCWKSFYECQTHCPGREKQFKTWKDTSQCPCRQTSKCLCHVTSISETFSTPVPPKMSCQSSGVSDKTFIYVDRSRDNFPREFSCCCQQCLSVGRSIASPARQVSDTRSRTCCCSRCRGRREPLIADSIISQRSTSPGCSCDDIELAYHRKYRNNWRESSQSLPTSHRILHKLKSTDSKRTKYTTTSFGSEPHYCCCHKIFGGKNMARYLDSQVTSQRSISRAVDLDCAECFGPTDHEFRTMLMQYVNLCRSVRHSLMKGFRQADTYKPSSTFNSRGSQSGFSRR